MDKICKYCGDKFISRIKSSYCCSNIICDRAKRRELYNNKIYTKNCVVCNEIYGGTKKSVICSDICKKKYQVKNIKYTIKVICKKCDTHINNLEKLTNIYGINTVRNILYRTCKKCKEDNYKRWSETQTGSNNTNYKEIKKVRMRKYTDEEIRRNMSINNPMKNEEVKKRVIKTLKSKYENGEIIRPIGKLSKLYKGNRKRSFTIRDRLKRWKIKYLKLSNYMCEICGVNNSKLEIHHKSEPFRDILEIFLNGRILDDLSYDEFEKLTEEIVQYHNDNVIGQVLCKKCHSEIDEFRKI